MLGVCGALRIESAIVSTPVHSTATAAFFASRTCARMQLGDAPGGEADDDLPPSLDELLSGDFAAAGDEAPASLDDLFGGDAPVAGDDGAATTQQWDDSSFEGTDSNFDGWTAPSVPPPRRREPTKPIETVQVGIVSGPYKRRKGYHAEVEVQHPGASSTIHRLWFAHEVLSDVAKLRHAQEYHIDVESFAEATVRFLQEKGVDLTDPDWGMDDDSIPFSTEHLPLRTLFAYYDELPEYLASATLADVPEEVGDTPIELAENLAKYEAKMEPYDIDGGEAFPCLGALAPDFSGATIGPILTGEPVEGPTGDEVPPTEEEEAVVA